MEMKGFACDPVERFETGDKRWGFEGPGWYFWDETWSYVYGPHPTKEAAREAVLAYARGLDTPVEDK